MTTGYWSWFCPYCRIGMSYQEEPPEPFCYGCGGDAEVDFDGPVVPFEDWWV